MSQSRLKANEFKVLQDASFFETKAAIELKLFQHFRDLNQAIRLLNEASNLPQTLLETPGRRYAGNQFQGYLPWHASDAIRAFKGDDLFCFRTVLLWGHHLSFNFVVGGKWLHQFLPSLLAHQAQLSHIDFHFSQQAGPWDWTFDGISHQPLNAFSNAEIRAKSEDQNWLKISRKIPLTSFDLLSQEGLTTWSVLLQILTKNA